MDQVTSMHAAHESSVFTFVTLNTWRLRDVARATRVLSALGELGRSLGHANGAPSDVLALQELESDAAIAALRDGLAPTHDLFTYVCATRRDGSNRSVVGLAVDRARFDVAHVECVPLGALWPDHHRGVLVATLRPRDRPDEALVVAAVHLSSRPGNRSQARGLRARLDALGITGATPALLAGDFNAPLQLPAYRTLAEAPWRDAFIEAPRHATHATGLRLDHVFVTPGLSLLRALDHERARAVCGARSAGSRAPLSDHVAVGGVFGSTKLRSGAT